MSFDSSALVSRLTPWMQTETWHTHHPMDMQRFHLALKKCFEQFGPAIDGDSFAQAMHELAGELYPDWDAEHLNRKVQHFALLAENIGSYLHDTRSR